MKRIVCLTLTVLCALCLCACGHEHEWTEATCTEPRTCSACGETEGEALGHSWAEATCTEPRTCSVCGETEGEALGHTVEEWTVTKEASCSETGLEEGQCQTCGETVEQETEKTEHIPGDWIVQEAPTEKEEGVRVIQCQVCGEELERETFSLSPEELKELYISECESISYDSLSRTPDDYKGRKVKFTGYVVQVCSEASSSLYLSTYRVATSGRYNNVIYLKVDNYGAGYRILEGDRITIYGTYDGLYSYTTIMGAKLTIPSVTAEYVD